MDEEEALREQVAQLNLDDAGVVSTQLWFVLKQSFFSTGSGYTYFRLALVWFV